MFDQQGQQGDESAAPSCKNFSYLGCVPPSLHEIANAFVVTEGEPLPVIKELLGARSRVIADMLASMYIGEGVTQSASGQYLASSAASEGASDALMARVDLTCIFKDYNAQEVMLLLHWFYDTHRGVQSLEEAHVMIAFAQKFDVGLMERQATEYLMGKLEELAREPEESPKQVVEILNLAQNYQLIDVVCRAERVIVNDVPIFLSDPELLASMDAGHLVRIIAGLQGQNQRLSTLEYGLDDGVKIRCSRCDVKIENCVTCRQQGHHKTLTANYTNMNGKFADSDYVEYLQKFNMTGFPISSKKNGGSSQGPANNGFGEPDV
eukprot:TRINITY_DN8904_c0_g2_i5.p1 TRINITY_DN8904_c0_g2~~TRINITY_DN8904_c0_g2_i5.p1  ORF type:complete len:372 (+),score=37.06 TRINITY_DN8904_c0_g2_i5:152-1117(+)